MVIDVHAHINESDITNIETKMSKFDSYYILSTGHSPKANCEVIEIIKDKHFFGVIGYNPEMASTFSNNDLITLEELANNPKVVAIGEIGLDYYYDYPIEEQKNLFKKQIELAIKLNLPIVIHNRDATADILNILKQYKNKGLRGIIHCFSGSFETATEYIKLGFLLSINGIVTFKNSNLPLVLKKLSLNNLVLETDSPYLSPTPYRGKVNDSSNIDLIAGEIAKIYDVTISEVYRVTTSNAVVIFDLSNKI